MQPSRPLKAFLVSAALAAGLSGCVALPPAVTVASLGIDIGSFALTGKTASDHLISAVAGEDCRLAGVLDGEICREEREFEAALAVLEPLPGDTQVAVSEEGPGTLEDDAPGVAVAGAASEGSPGFTIPSGTVITEEPELPVGGFSFGKGRGSALPKGEAAPGRLEEAEDTDRAHLDLAGYLTDDSLPLAQKAANDQQLAVHLGSAHYLTQGGLDLDASS